MNDPTPATRWSTPIQLLHWLTVVLVVALGILGLWMTDLPRGPDKITVYALHKSLGLTVLALTLLRLAVRTRSATPALPDATPRWQRGLAHGMQVVLYLLLLALPLTGWIYNSASGFPLRWFGLVALPALGAADPERKALFELLHEALFWTLATAVALHAGAALQHHFRNHDDILRRMLPRRWFKDPR
jgi:cytochrome b561